MAVCEQFRHHDVEALRVGRFGNKINTACILYRIGDTIIDTGPPNQWSKIRKFIEERRPAKLLLTHHHEDHSGNARRFQKKWDVAIFAHPDAAPLLKKGFPVPLYRRLVWGNPKVKVETKALPDLVATADGLILKPIHCPGHAEDQVSFLEPNRGWVFTGDLFIACKPKFLRKAENPNQEIQSLRRLLTQDFDTVFCAHRGLVANGKEALKEKLSYLVALREQVRHYLQVGDSLKEIRNRLLGSESGLTYFSLGDFSKHNFISAFARHLRYAAYSDEQSDWEPTLLED